MMYARFKIDVRLTGRGLVVGIGVVEGTLDDDIHATDRIDDAAIAGEIHHRVVVDGDAEVVLDGRLDQRGAAVRIAR